MSRAKRALLAAISLVVLISALEVAFSLYYFFVVTPQNREMLEPLLGITGPEKQETLRYRPHPYFNYVFNREYRYPDGFAPYNSFGFRAPEWTPKRAGTVRIVAVGGSTTYGIFSRDGSGVWPALLEQRLNAGGGPPVEILNLGVTGYTLPEIMGVMAMLVPELDPDVVLINAGANDALAAGYPDEGGPDNTTFRFSWSVPKFPESAKFWMRKSYTVRVLGMLALSVGNHLPGDMMTAIQYPHPDDSDAARHAANASGKYFRRNLLTVVFQALRAGAVPVLLTQPMNPEWETVESPFYRGVVAAFRRNNEIIREVGKESEVLVVDLAVPMRSRELFVDAVHPNQRGEQLETGIMHPEIAAVVAAVHRARSRFAR